MRRSVMLRVTLAVVVVAIAVGAPIAWWVTRTEVTCGIVVGLDQASITDVRGFSLRTPEGVVSTYVIVPGRLAPTSFVPGHLREHRALATPVCVTFRPAESPAVALDLRDAPAPDDSVAPGT
jgi:hypothetical protein